jgi:glycosyltransferase involved in cell wall biosynthesis
MVVGDDEATLNDCLKSCASAFNEIIIVDIGSTDKTKEIALNYTGEVFDFPWQGSYAAAQNFSFSKASGDYIMWLDADESLSLEALRLLKSLKKYLSRETDVVMMNLRDFDRPLNTDITYYRERIFRRFGQHHWREPVHEYVPVAGKVVTSDITITKSSSQAGSDKALSIYENLIAQGMGLSSRGQLFYARELRNQGRTDEAVTAYEDFLNLENGWVEDYISARFELAMLYRGRGESDKMIGALLDSFKYAPPRAEICSGIGYYHFDNEDYAQAAYWYEQAMKLEPEKAFSWRTVYEDYCGFVPALQLCLCHYNLGDTQKAEDYNKLAKRYKLDNESVLYNEKLFARLKRPEDAEQTSEK